MAAAARVVAGVAGTGVPVVGAAYAGCYGVVDGHAVVADVFGAGVVVVDGDTGGAAPACPQPAEIDPLVTGSREERSCEQAEEARATDDGKVTLHDGSPGQDASIGAHDPTAARVADEHRLLQMGGRARPKLWKVDADPEVEATDRLRDPVELPRGPIRQRGARFHGTGILRGD